MNDKMERPSLTHTVALDDGTKKEIKFTYGLFQDMQRLVPDPGLIVDVILESPDTRDYLVRRAMTDTAKIVTDFQKELIAAEDMNLNDPDEISDLLNWIGEHLLYFFGRSATGLKTLADRFKKMRPSETLPSPSESGSKSSA